MAEFEMEASYDAIARIFLVLSKMGLRKSRLSIAEIYPSASIFTTQNISNWRDQNALFEDVMNWLAKERAIYFDESAKNEFGVTFFEGVQFTSRGFELANSDRVAVLIQDNSAKNVAAIPRDLSSDTRMQKLGELFGSGIAAFTKTIAS